MTILLVVLSLIGGFALAAAAPTAAGGTCFCRGGSRSSPNSSSLAQTAPSDASSPVGRDRIPHPSGHRTVDGLRLSTATETTAKSTS